MGSVSATPLSEGFAGAGLGALLPPAIHSESGVALTLPAALQTAARNRAEAHIRSLKVKRFLLAAVLCTFICALGAELTAAQTKKRKSTSDSDESAVTPSPKKKSTGTGSTKSSGSTSATPKKPSSAKSSTPSSKTKKLNAATETAEPSEPTPKTTPESTTETAAGETASKKSGAAAEPSATPKKKAAEGTKSTTKTGAANKKSTGTSSGTPKPKSTPKPDEKPSDSASTAKATPSPSATPAATPTPKPLYAPSASLATTDLLGFSEQPPRVQKLIEDALALARLNLTYKFGSDDPAQGGMDCSGTVAYLLRQQGFRDVPRDSAGQYTWARKNGQFFAVVSKKTGGFEFAELLPGDLMFWSGTYDTPRDPPVTHSMIYLGVQRKRGQHVMWGSSDGRSYDGKARFGVSVFDFKMPRADTGAARSTDFLGYGRIPGLREEEARPTPVVAPAKP